MGGNAFGSILRSSAFPRLSPKVYHALKMRMQPLLEELYVYVGVPHVAPEKMDHGDLDLIVCLPRRHTIPTQSSVVPNISDSKPEGLGLSVNVPHEIVAAAIKAEHLITMDGNRVSNFAVPILGGEWAVHDLTEAEAEEKARRDAGEEGIYYQVDVDVCESKDEWSRRLLFHSHGDLSMIMGLIAKNVGLHLSNKGLKYPNPPNPPLILTESFDEIFTFFGWSMDEWNSGFETTLASYKWAANSRFMNFAHFKSHGSEIKKRKSDRPMYSEFIEWAASLSQDPAATKTSCEIPDGREAALDFFNKHSELNERRTSYHQKQVAKNVFSGTNVRDWTDLGGYWLGVKKIMDGVRERLGGDQLIGNFVVEKGEEKLKCIVLEVQAELGVWPKSKNEASEAVTVNREEVDASLEQDVEKLKL